MAFFLVTYTVDYVTASGAIPRGHPSRHITRSLLYVTQIVRGPLLCDRPSVGIPSSSSYGEVKLNMTRRLALNAAQTVETNAESS